MDLQALSDALFISNDKLSLGNDTVPGLDLSSLLAGSNGGASLVLSGAVKTTGAANVTVTGTGTILGAVNAKITAVFSLDASQNPSLKLTAKLTGAPDAKLSTLVSNFRQSATVLPTNFDIPIPATDLLLTAARAGFTFNLGATATDFAVVMFTVESTSPAGFTAGVEIQSGGLSAISGLAPIGAIEQLVGLSGLLLVVSSFSAPDVPFPSASEFDAPSFNGEIQLPDGAGGLKAGVNAYAKLSASNSQAFTALTKWIGLRLDGTAAVAISIAAPNPASGSQLFVSCSGEVQKGVTLEGQIGIGLATSVPFAFVSGTMKVMVGAQLVQFTVQSIVSPNGILVSGTARGTISVHGISLSNVALVIGINFQGIPSLGVAGIINGKSFGGSAAVFFDSTNPSNSMLAGATDDVRLLDIATSLAGQSAIPGPIRDTLGQLQLTSISSASTGSFATALDGGDLAGVRAGFSGAGVTLSEDDESLLLVTNSAGSFWHLADLGANPPAYYSVAAGGRTATVSLQPQLYIAPVETHIGALTFEAGFRIGGMLQVFFLKVKTNIAITENTGILADVDVAPIVIGPSHFFAITDAGGSSGPRLSIATFAQNNSDPRLAEPHALISGAVRVLGVTFSSVYVSLSAAGLVVALERQVAPVGYKLNGTFSDPTNFSLSGTATIGFVNQALNLGPLGSINVNTNVQGGLNLGFNGTTASAGFAGSFNFQDLANVSLPPMQLDVNTPALANLANLVWPQVSTAISSALTDPTRWLAWVRSGTISGIDTSAAGIAKILAGTFGLSANDIASYLKQYLGFNFVDIAKGLYGAGVSLTDARAALSSIGAGFLDIANAIRAAFS